MTYALNVSEIAAEDVLAALGEGAALLRRACEDALTEDVSVKFGRSADRLNHLRHQLLSQMYPDG